MRVALVTASELPRPDYDLPILVDAFAAAGARAEVVAWDDPSADWSRFDLALIRSTWNYVAHFDRFCTWLDATDKVTRLANPLPLVRWNLHKRYLIELAAAGIPVVPTECFAAGADIAWDRHFARWGDLVVKPAISAGSFATIRVPKGDHATVHAHHLEHTDRDLLVQPLLQSVLEYGETNLVFFGGEFSHAIHKGARWSGQTEQSRGLVDPSEAELGVARQVLAHVNRLGFGHPIYARVDLARGADDKMFLMELEVVEPSLFLDRVPGQAAQLVQKAMLTGSHRGA